MTHTRDCLKMKLKNQPLVLVLAQIRFTPIGNLAQYMPKILDDFRKNGYPFQEAGFSSEIIIDIRGTAETKQHPRWSLFSDDKKWSIIIEETQMVMQTVDYDTFEPFIKRFLQALELFMKGTEHDTCGRLLRLGLRYADLIQPRKGEDCRTYLQSAFHGVNSAIFDQGAARFAIEIGGRVWVGEKEAGTMLVRAFQNDQGLDLPPDLFSGAPVREKKLAVGELVTILDTDHFWECQDGRKVDYEWMNGIFFKMHDHIVTFFLSHVVTEEALKIWK